MTYQERLNLIDDELKKMDDFAKNRNKIIKFIKVLENPLETFNIKEIQKNKLTINVNLNYCFTKKSFDVTFEKD